MLDLCCCAGGASMGLHRAWPDAQIVGVDIMPQKHYPFEFVQADAMEYPLEGFDFIWASPPCQKYTIAGRLERSRGKRYPDLLAPMREKLIAAEIPWAIENVPGAPMRADFILCGSMFDLPIVRHRLIEVSFGFALTPSCSHGPDTLTICGHGTPSWTRKLRKKRGQHPNVSVNMKRAAMDCHWMNREELSQAIPPAYSEYIAKAYAQAEQRPLHREAAK